MTKTLKIQAKNLKKAVLTSNTSDLFRKSFDLTFFKKVSQSQLMTLTFFIFRRKSAENGQSQIDFSQNLLDFCDFGIKKSIRFPV